MLTDADHSGQRQRANACRAWGLRPIDGPFTDFGDADGFCASAQRAKALDFEGKWAIHPSQVELANVAFSPSTEELAWAARTRQRSASAGASVPG